MPKIMINTNDYAVKNFTNKVRGRCAELRINQSQLADVLDLKQSALSQKMKKGNYTLIDFLKITKYLNFSDEEILKILK